MFGLRSEHRYEVWHAIISNWSGPLQTSLWQDGAPLARFKAGAASFGELCLAEGVYIFQNIGIDIVGQWPCLVTDEGGMGQTSNVVVRLLYCEQEQVPKASRDAAKPNLN